MLAGDAYLSPQNAAARHPLSSVWPRQPGYHLSVPVVSRRSMASSEDGEDRAVTVEKVHQIRTAGQRQGMVVPADMVLSAEGKDYMKILPSRVWFCKLVCPKAATQVKNISLHGCPQMKAMMEAVWSAYLATDEDHEAAAALFKEGAEKPSVKRKRTASARLGEPLLVSLPDGTEAEFLVQSHKSCPAVLLEDKSVASVLSYLAADCSECGSAESRQYCRSGKYAKRAK